MSRNGLRTTIEYGVLLATFGAGLLLGTHHPLSASTHHTVVHDIASASRIFVGNLAYTLMIGILSLFTGGFVGICILFLVGFSFGHVANLYWHSSELLKIFPVLEFLSLVMMTQQGLDLFLSLVSRTCQFSRGLFAVSMTIAFAALGVAAYMEGILLHV